jgi:hypothetical protein
VKKEGENGGMKGDILEGLSAVGPNVMYFTFQGESEI